MADVVPTTPNKPLQMAGVFVGGVLAFNVLFWIASSYYFDDKPAQQAEIAPARFAFATLSLVVAVVAYAAALAPRLLGHGLAFLIGVASFAGGIAALAKDLPPVMGATLLIVGLIVPTMSWKSLNHSRTAWSFLISLVAVFATVTFFGAPKVRGLLHIGLWYAMIIPGLMIVCATALAMLRREFHDRV